MNVSKKREDKLLKSIYLGNIIKMEYKIFNSNIEIEEKKANGGDIDKVKKESKNIIEKIENKFKEGKIPFFFYI